MSSELMQQIANFGFPIIVSMYLLIRIEGKMESLTTSIQQLANALENEKK